MIAFFYFSSIIIVFTVPVLWPAPIVLGRDLASNILFLDLGLWGLTLSL
jgi:hypothetical protein